MPWPLKNDYRPIQHYVKQSIAHKEQEVLLES